MKQIDSRFPVFMQLECGDKIYIIDLTEETIYSSRITKIVNDTIFYNDSYLNIPFNYGMIEAHLQNYHMTDNGYGFATSYEAAKEGVKQFLEEKISKIKSEIEIKEKTIIKLGDKKDYFNKLINKFS